MTPLAYRVVGLVGMYCAWKVARQVGRWEGIEEAERLFALNHETFVETQRKRAPWQ